MIITVEFPEETISQIENTIPGAAQRMSNPQDQERELRRIVQNAMRVYLQLRSIAKGEPVITVISDREKYRIDLG